MSVVEGPHGRGGTAPPASAPAPPAEGSTLLVVRSLPLATAPQGPDREDRAVRRR